MCKTLKQSCRRSFVLVFLVAVAFLVAGFQSLPQTSPDVEVNWSNIGEYITHDDVAVRRKAAWHLAVRQPEQQPAATIIALSKKALADADSEVKRRGVVAVHRVAWAQAAKAEGPKPRKLEIGQDDELYAMLLDAAGDPSLEQAPGMGESVGWSAVFALGFLYWDRPELEQALIDLYQRREGKSRYDDVQAAVLMSMEYPRFESDESRTILLTALKDDHQSVQRTAAQVLGKRRLEGGVQALAEAYLVSDNQELRKAFGTAILAYEDAAEQIESIRAEAVARAEAAEKLMKFIESRDYKSLD